MLQRVRRISILPAAITFGILYAILGLLVAPFLWVVTRVAPSGFPPFPFQRSLLLLPVLYGCVGFVVTAIAAALYNLISGWVGGIEVDLTETGSAGL